MKKRRLASLVLLSMLLGIMTSCSKGSDDADSPSGYVSGEKVSMSFMMPVLSTDVLVNSEYADGQSTRFTSTWNNDGKVFMFAKQNGKYINLGRYSIAATNTDNSIFKVEVDASDKLNTKASYQLYGLSGLYNVDNNELFYRVNLARNGGFGLWFSGENGKTKMSNVAGTAEMLFVINKTDKPIKFVHKGYDAEEKWYYTKAEVSVEDGHIQKAEQGTEVVGTAKEIKAYDGKTLPRVISYYVPNGKKIQDAQLIAEIDGKEVRSENRISSDIIPQTNHSYGIFAVWDGERLTLGDGDGNTVIDLSDPENSEVEMTSFESDGTITVKTTADKLPQVGSYLCSGPTEQAPYGFLARVTEVDQQQAATKGVTDIVAKIKTVAANINEIVESGDYQRTFTYGFDDLKISEVTDAEGNRLELIKTEEKKWKLPVKSIKRGEVSITPEVTLVPHKFHFSIDIKDRVFNSISMDMDMNIESSIRIDAALKAKKEVYIPLYNVFIEPITFAIGPVPIVITPLFQIYAKFDATGEISISCVPVRNNHYLFLGAVLDGQTGNMTPVKGHNDYFEAKNEGAGLLPYADMEKGFAIKGSASASAGVSASVGLYGCNYAKRVSFLNTYLDFLGDLVAIDLWGDFVHKMNATFSMDNINMENTYMEYHFNDALQCSDYLQGHLSFILNYWNPLSLKKCTFSPTLETPPLYFFKDYGARTLFVSEFSKFRASLSQQGLVFSATKYRPFFGYGIFEEQSFGVRYRKYDEEDNWVDVDMSHSYQGELYRAAAYYDVTCSVPLGNLEKGQTYVAYPYIYIKAPDGTLSYIYRQGIHFEINYDGTLTINALPVIPGEEL